MALYAELPDNYIRLLHLEPGETGTPLLGSLLPIDVSQRRIRHDYLALSYTWDSPTETTTLTLRETFGGLVRSISITTSLFDALNQLRHPSHVLILWVDQICIDQSSVTDKEQQVSTMAQIYARAQGVIVWLGKASDDSDLAMDELASGKLQSKLSVDIPRTTSGSEEQVLAAMTNLASRRYWRRSWILQEATAKTPAETHIICGEKKVSMEAIVSFRNAHHYLPPLTEQSSFQLRKLHLVFQATEAIWVFQFLKTRFRPKLFRFLDHVAVTQTTDPRDKIYSMISFSAEQSQPGPRLQPDYSISPFDAYVSCALWHISTYKNLHVLGFCSGDRLALSTEASEPGRPLAVIGGALDTQLFTSMASRTQSLPSWAPTWTRQAHVPGISPLLSRMRDDSSKGHDNFVFKACGPFTSVKCDRYHKPKKSVTHLSVLGIRLADVGGIQAEESSEEFLDSNFPESQAEGNTGKICELTGLPRREVLAQTLRADVQVCNWSNGEVFYRRVSQGTARKEGPGRFELGVRTTWHAHADIDESVEQFKRSYRLFRTTGGQNPSRGLFGLAPLSARLGDEVWLLQGCRVLVILRPRASSEFHMYSCVDLETGQSDVKGINVGEKVYEYVGESFILGLMDGEAVKMLRSPPKRPRPPALASMYTEFRSVTLF